MERPKWPARLLSESSATSTRICEAANSAPSLPPKPSSIDHKEIEFGKVTSVTLTPAFTYLLHFLRQTRLDPKTSTSFQLNRLFLIPLNRQMLSFRNPLHFKLISREHYGLHSTCCWTLIPRLVFVAASQPYVSHSERGNPLVWIRNVGPWNLTCLQIHHSLPNPKLLLWKHGTVGRFYI